MNPKMPKGKRVVSAGIGLPPSLIKRLDEEKGDYSRSKFAAIIIRQYFEAIDARRSTGQRGGLRDLNQETIRK